MSIKAMTDIQNIPEFSMFEIVWAKLIGFPWWPGKIIDICQIDDTEINKQVFSQLNYDDNKKKKENSIIQSYHSEEGVSAEQPEIRYLYKVQFFQEKSNAYLQKNKLQPYLINRKKYWTPKNFNDQKYWKPFEQAKFLADSCLGISHLSKYQEFSCTIQQIERSTSGNNLYQKKEKEQGQNFIEVDKQYGQGYPPFADNQKKKTEQSNMNSPPKDLQQILEASQQSQSEFNSKNKTKTITKGKKKKMQKKREEELALLQPYNLHLIPNRFDKKFKIKKAGQRCNYYRIKKLGEQNIRVLLVQRLYEIIKSKRKSEELQNNYQYLRNMALNFAQHLFRSAQNSTKHPHSIYYGFLRWAKSAHFDQIQQKQTEIFETQIREKTQKVEEQLNKKVTVNASDSPHEDQSCLNELI